MYIIQTTVYCIYFSLLFFLIYLSFIISSIFSTLFQPFNNMLIAQINIVENGSDRREPPKVVDPEGKHKARKVDKISRKLFPIAFLLFNIIYWIFYAVPLSHPSKN